jgi:hypothetical protein
MPRDPVLEDRLCQHFAQEVRLWDAQRVYFRRDRLGSQDQAFHEEMFRAAVLSIVHFFL